MSAKAAPATKDKIQTRQSTRTTDDGYRVTHLDPDDITNWVFETPINEGTIEFMEAGCREPDQIEPIVVRKLSEGSIQGIDGRHRTEVCRRKGWQVPALYRDYTDDQALEQAIKLNVVRRDLNTRPAQLAMYLRVLREEHFVTSGNEITEEANDKGRPPEVPGLLAKHWGGHRSVWSRRCSAAKAWTDDMLREIDGTDLDRWLCIEDMYRRCKDAEGNWTKRSEAKLKKWVKKALDADYNVQRLLGAVDNSKEDGRSADTAEHVDLMKAGYRTLKAKADEIEQAEEALEKLREEYDAYDEIASRISYSAMENAPNLTAYQHWCTAVEDEFPSDDPFPVALVGDDGKELRLFGLPLPEDEAEA